MLPIRPIILLALLAFPATTLADVITFDDLSLGPESNWHGPDPNGTDDGQSIIGGFESGGISFANRYHKTFGTWGGFAYSNVTNTTDTGYSNQWSAVTGSGRGSGDDIYGVAYGYDALQPNDVDPDPFDPTSAADLRELPSFSLASGQTIEGLFVTNTTLTANSMQNGDGFAKQFGGATGDDPDWYKLTAYGIDALGNPLSTAVEFFLADYRFADNSRDFIIDDWTFFDLSALAGARSLHFNLSSSDVGDFGMNTPSFFAVDDIQVTAAVPEPASLVLLGGSLLAGGVWGRFRGRFRSK